MKDVKLKFSTCWSNQETNCKLNLHLPFYGQSTLKHFFFFRILSPLNHKFWINFEKHKIQALRLLEYHQRGFIVAFFIFSSTFHLSLDSFPFNSHLCHPFSIPDDAPKHLCHRRFNKRGRQAFFFVFILTKLSYYNVHVSLPFLWKCFLWSNLFRYRGTIFDANLLHSRLDRKYLEFDKFHELLQCIVIEYERNDRGKIFSRNNTERSVEITFFV